MIPGSLFFASLVIEEGKGERVWDQGCHVLLNKIFFQIPPKKYLPIPAQEYVILSLQNMYR